MLNPSRLSSKRLALLSRLSNLIYPADYQDPKNTARFPGALLMRRDFLLRKELFYGMLSLFVDMLCISI